MRILTRIACTILMATGAYSASATHLMGGELTYNYLDANGPAGTPFRFEITLNLYVYCSDPASVFYNNGDQGTITVGVFNNQTTNLYTTLQLDPVLTDATPEPQAGCQVPVSQGVDLNDLCIKLNQYRGVINLPAGLQGYHIAIERCCRNGNILNLSNAGDQSMAIYTEIPATIFTNSSPNFTSAAIPVICANDTVSIVNNAFDPDGDQLIYGLAQPYGGLYASQFNPGIDPGFGGGEYDTYAPPHPVLAYTSQNYSVASPFGVGSYASVNAATGLTQYYATTPGNYVIAVDVYEYRQIAGVDSLIGTTRRDLQFIVVSCPVNESPEVDIPNPGSIGAPIVNDIIYIEQGDSLNFQIAGFDPDSNDLEISGQGPIIDGTTGYNGPLASITTQSNPVSVTSTFDWKTDCTLEGNYNFTVDVKDDGCPSKTESEVYTINVSAFELKSGISGSQSVCNTNPDKSYSINPNTNSTIEWSVINGSINGSNTGSSVDVTWGTSGTSQIKVIETSQFGCKDSLTINIVVNDPDTLQASEDTSYCEGNNLTLNVSGTVSPLWSPNVNISSTTSVTPTVFPDSDQWYYVKSASSCTLKDSVFVRVIKNEAPPADSMYVCPDVADSIEITPVAGYTYSWSPSNGLGDSTVLNTTITLPGMSNEYNAYYVLNSVDTNGCVFEDSMKVVVKNKPVIDSINGAFSVCPLSEGMLYWLDSDDYFSYDWSAGGGTVVSQVRHNASIDWGQVNDSAWVGLQVVDFLGCKSDTNKFPVTINSTIKSETPSGLTPVCKSSATNIPYNVQHYGGNATYTWFYSYNGNLYNGGFPSFLTNGNTIIMNWDSVGTLDLWVKVNYPTSDTVACLVESDVLEITVAPEPTPLAISGAPDTLCEGDGTGKNYGVSGLPNSSYQWTITGGTIIGSDTNSSINVDWTNFGTNTVSVIETSEYGCVGTLVKENIQYNPTPTPSFVGPSLVCDGYLESVDHTAEGWTGSTFVMVANGGNGTHHSANGDTITVDWTGIENLNNASVTVIEYASNGCIGEKSFPVNYSVETADIEYVTTQYNDPEVVDIFMDVNTKNNQFATLSKRITNTADSWENIANITGTTASFTDQDVETGQFAYDYQISFDNECGQLFTSSIHTSILLEGINDGNASALLWNRYMAWDSGVAYYEVWRSLDGGPWELYDDTDGSTGSRQYPNGEDGLEMCYRVGAVKNDTNEIISWSNEICLDFPHPIIVYNAFSPNGDDKNETFYVENLQYYTVESIEILNRWGNVVYQSDSYDNQWNGGDLSDGTYLYVLKIEEFEEPFKGTVLLHR